MKKYIIGFILGALIFGSIGVLATTVITADQINYDENTTVKDKIDDLYTKSTTWKNLSTPTTVVQDNLLNGETAYDNDGNLITGTLPNTKTYEFSLLSDTTKSDAYYSSIFEFNNTKYKYFKITNLTKDSNVSDCYLASWSNARSEEIRIDVNTQYEVGSNTDNYRFGSIVLYSKGKSTAWARCRASIIFYN